MGVEALRRALPAVAFDFALEQLWRGQTLGRCLEPMLSEEIFSPWTVMPLEIEEERLALLSAGEIGWESAS